jgi:ABC-2 type transport system ATP-binding protein
VLVYHRVTKQFSGSVRPALDSVEFDVPDGEVVGLVGLNGAGKTTLLRLSAGVAYPSAGSILVDGLDIRREKREASRHVGWVPDISNFDLGTRAIAQLRYLAGFYDDLRPGEARLRCSELLKLVGLEGKERAKLRTYSQGMLKRYAIAAAMLSDPRNYLLDEVLNDLDIEGIQLIRSWLRQMRETKRAILLSSHDLVELQDLCDRVAVLHEGHLLRVVSRGDLERIARGLTKFLLEIENLDSAGLEYLRSIGEVDVGKRQLRLTTKGLAAADIAAELVHRGYRISVIRPEDPPLEAYFSRLMAEAK